MHPILETFWNGLIKDKHFCCFKYLYLILTPFESQAEKQGEIGRGIGN
jgi:hypothetical protein